MDKRKTPGRYVVPSSMRSKSNLGEKDTIIAGGLKSNIQTQLK